jgi:2-oxoglutarate dehydrogenase E1 component
MPQSLKDSYASTPLAGANASYVEALYEQFLSDPQSVPADWRQFFSDPTRGNAADVAHGPVRAGVLERARAPRAATGAAAEPAVGGDHDAANQGAVARMVQLYVNRGHLIADLDPLKLTERPVPRVLEMSYLGLSAADLDTEFYTASRTASIPKRIKLRELIARLKQIYCGTIGAEFAHVSDTEERLWLQDRFQSDRLQLRFSAEEQKSILWQLTAAEGLERYLHTKYVGQKRFSLEGGDSLIPLLDELIQQAGARGAEDVVLGMAHRGRLNVLVNVLGKSPGVLYAEFEGSFDREALAGSGDVKYHKGFSADLRTAVGNVHVVLAFNPSHLEIVDPVVEGSVRARQEARGDNEGDKVVPVLVHGDAAFAGQGVVTETLQLSQARGFYTGGTIHVVVNNQIGFTMSDPHDARSTLYCTDVAKMIEAPIFHVNTDDPEAVLLVTRIAVEYRMKFHKDVVIDLVCYRRHGHNEADEPAATQPMMYQAIRNHPTTRQLYVLRLTDAGIIGADAAQAMIEDYRKGLDEGRPQARAALGMIGNAHTIDWSRYHSDNWSEIVHTAIDLDALRTLAHAMTSTPRDFVPHPRVARILQDRARMAAGDLPLDWGFAETLAYASLLKQGHKVRLTGQDSGRGTFFHRHAVLHDQKTGARWVPLEHVADGQPRFTVTDSVLSEEAVLGFEYGYSTADPNTLTIWEGQFGDFANGAQVVIDQFISSGEAKWGRLSGLVLFLPHGYEGQGPEHSSARLERFLQLTAEANIQVCVPSTPAQMFHMLRRQMVRGFRKPLVVMTPKSLLRHKLSVSSLRDITHGRFQPVIGESDELVAADVERVVVCAGKVYFDLLEQRRADKLKNVALVRIEQLYPFPTDEYLAAVDHYPNAREVVWCQEEPQNQGSWYQIRHRLQEGLSPSHTLLYAGRPGAAAPACGIYQLHLEQQHWLVDAALKATTVVDSARDTQRLSVKALRKMS